MKVIKTGMEGFLVIEPDLFSDERGFFLETFQSGYKELCKIPNAGLPVTELLSNTILSLPLYPGLDESKIKFITDSLVN